MLTSRNRCLGLLLLLSSLAGYWSTLQVASLYLPRLTAAAGHYQGQSAVSCITPELVTLGTLELVTLGTLVTTLCPVSPLLHS